MNPIVPSSPNMDPARLLRYSPKNCFFNLLVRSTASFLSSDNLSSRLLMNEMLYKSYSVKLI